MTAELRDVVVIGAGVAGLSCARALSAAGRDVLVVERSRGVGGRCATRRVDGQPVDHGVAFLHGDLPEFLAALDAVPSERVEGWPSVIEGTGTACQPRAFGVLERRLAYADGVNAFARNLARDAHVALHTTVQRLEVQGATLAVHATQPQGEVMLRARSVVLAMAGPQSLTLLSGLESSPSQQSACALLRMLPSLPCLTVIAAYPKRLAPPWHMMYPETSRILQLVSHDSSKRPAAQRTLLVMQARPAWSRNNLDADTAVWTNAMVADVATSIGTWALSPESVQSHRWSYARVGADSELSRPVVVETSGGARVGLVGEQFAPGGGVQAAWHSGLLLARRMLGDA